jgi:hypothetical protein
MGGPPKPEILKRSVLFNIRKGWYSIPCEMRLKMLVTPNPDRSILMYEHNDQWTERVRIWHIGQ